MSYTEAKKLLTAGQLDEFKMDVDEYIKQASAIPVSKEWQVALEKAAARQRVTRLEAILVHLQQHIEQLFGKQEQLLQEGLENLYKREYYHTAFELDKGFEMAHEFGGINTNKLNDILKKPWAADGSNFSSRVWQHKQNLVNTLQQEMTRAVIRGDDFRTATKNISDKMNVSQSAAGRLVMTESAFFASKGMADCLREFGVDEYEFIATLDRRTSQICRDMDKKVFKLSEFKPGTTAPPLHCYCRSHIAPYFADAAISERIARGKDGKTYMIPSNMNYKDWERVYVKKEISLEQWQEELKNPKIELKTWEQAGKLRTKAEFEELGRKDKTLVEEYTGIPSKWSGNIIVNKNGRCRKEWSCDIWLHEDAPEHVLIHELIHSCSASYSDSIIFSKNRMAEELPVHFMSQEIAALKNIDVIASGYDEGADLIRQYKNKLGLKIANIGFAKQILQQPIQERWDWLESLMLKKLDPASTSIEKYTELADILEELREWQPNMN